MKFLRQIHLLLGCLFAPLIVYFCLSGAWQIFRLNDLPKETPASSIQVVLHELSKPHKNSTLPNLNSKTDRSILFSGLALTMALGMVSTAVIGVYLAFRSARSRKLAVFLLISGILLPIGLLFLK